MYVSIDSLLFISKRKTHMIVAPVCKQNPYTVTPECIHQQRNEKSIKSISTRDCAKGARDEIKKRTKADEVVEIKREV